MEVQEQVLRLRLARSFSLMCLAGVMGTLGYWLLWRHQGGTFMDAVYMTGITMTTIGFLEVKPLDTVGRLLTLAVAVVGIGSLFYMLTAVMDYLVSGQMLGFRERRKMNQRIAALSQQVIIAGLGRVGRETARELTEGRVPFVVIDVSEQARLLAAERGYLFIQGDSTADEVLQQAGVDRARGLIVTTDNDATNLYVVMSARLLNPKLNIVSRAVDQKSVGKLLRAGANQAINPYAIGGRRLAHLILSPSVVDFLETALTRGNRTLDIQDLVIREGSPGTRGRLESLHLPQVGATLLAVLRDGAPVVNPPGDFQLHPGDHLLALGTPEQLQRFAQVLEGTSGESGRTES